ncbi:hypothetical protein GR160_03435 [Flavobacterium sp. Sd200]|uniref:hypothetical protein n=1 Tax=Flavobacterium sp. Sd200 TaxID=2692211 RepID=UPI00136D8779|nr:hypothetical protein [Flavobacterium sp. Sd200]MXN90268.1 hypothetical protein [Flavobacterium sp. Sd200]
MKKIILSAIVLLIATACKKTVDAETVIEETSVEKTTPLESSGSQCYLTVAESVENDKVVNDTLSLNFERTGDSITGEFKWLPFYKDKKTGTFKGVVTNNIANTILIAQAEGVNNKEEFIFEIKPDRVLVKMGEMKEGENGLWQYKNSVSASDVAIAISGCK